MKSPENSFISKKISDMPFSGIRKYFDLAAQMKGVVSLGVGEPDFTTPWHIKEEAIYRLENGATHYTSNAGLLELRQEISKYMEKYDLHYDPTNEVLVTVGASEAIDVALRAVLEPGDEVLVQEPCFVSYKPCVTMAGGTPVPLVTKAENEFRLTAEELAAAITPRTKALMISFPNNPTGAIMERKDLEALAAVLRDKHILVISDEIYSELTYTDAPHTSIASLEGMRDKTLVINGFSKSYAMTGWRLGYVCGPSEIMTEMLKIHQYIIMCAPTTAQYAGIEALRNGDNDVERMRTAYDERRRFMVKGLRDIGMDVFEPRGAFYLFPSVAVSGLSSDEFCQQLLQEERLAVIPGNAFGECGEGFVRCSYAYSIEELKEALARLERFIAKCKK